MKKIICRLVVGSMTLISFTVTADELTGYVQNCESELGFATSEVPTLDCNDGILFKGGRPTDIGPENDFVGHARVNANVDLVFACRWLSDKLPTRSSTAVTIELLIHNRQNGGTCFFEAKDTNPPGTDITVFESQVSTTIVSPTDPGASNYWMQPRDLNAKKFSAVNGITPNGFLRCVGCHVAGPYIASVDVAPALQQFGLLNDGHDTFATRYHAVLPPPTLIFGRPLGLSSFWNWNNIIQANNSAAGCAAGCHSIGLNSTADDLVSFVNSDAIVPSLKNDIAFVNLRGVMPADNPVKKDTDNSYRWVNMDVPDDRGDYEESETLSDLKILYPRFYCAKPVSLSAHVIDSDEIMNTGDLPDTFNRFNLQDGLVCLNQDQPSGRCQNYQTRYQCNGRWLAWQGNDDPGASGDWEPRNSFKNLCANPTGIQARYKTGNVYIIANGPPDRLVQFDKKGLVCHNADQNNFQCSNYVVRFECP